MEDDLMFDLFGGIAAGIVEMKAVDASALTWEKLLGTPSSRAGVAVNLDSALRVSTVLACTRVLAQGIAQLPLKVYRIGERSRKPATDLSLYKVLSGRPNEWMTAYEFWEFMMFHAVLTFNAYAYIGWGGGEVQELIPIPGAVRVEQRQNYQLVYHLENGQTLTEESVLHLRGPSWNGYEGLDALHLAREAIGLAIATEETHSRLFANAARPGGLLSVEGKLSKETRADLRQRIAEVGEGLNNAHRTLVLDQSAKWHQMAMSGVDSQHLETRRYQIEEICRNMQVYPQMVMSGAGASGTPTFASASQFRIAHVTDSLAPWGRRIEQKIDHTLLRNAPGLHAKFNFAALMRGDAAERAAFYQSALGGARPETAYMTRNEVRELEELDPIDGGDELPNPMAPILPPAQSPAPPA
jgi:HK97 family phage portal protein